MNAHAINVERLPEAARPLASLIGTSRNIPFVAAAIAHRMRKTGQHRQANEMIDRISKSRDDDEALDILMQYVDSSEKE